MDDLQSEKEQIEEIRAWWTEYGNYVLGGVAIGAIGLFGFNYVRNQEINAQESASMLYSELADKVVEQDLDASNALVDELTAEHAGSPYLTQAQFAVARLYMDQNRDEDAANALRDVISGTANEEFKMIARLRLAKILLHQEKADEVVTLLEGMEDGAFAARIADALGDAYVALDRLGDARAAYQRALAEQGDAATVNQTFVQLKLLDLPIETVAGISEPQIPEDQLPTNEAPADDEPVEEAPAEEGE